MALGQLKPHLIQQTLNPPPQVAEDGAGPFMPSQGQYLRGAYLPVMVSSLIKSLTRTENPAPFTIPSLPTLKAQELTEICNLSYK